jgi:hypothetical protein
VAADDLGDEAGVLRVIDGPVGLAQAPTRFAGRLMQIGRGRIALGPPRRVVKSPSQRNG